MFDPDSVADRLEINELCARYALHLSRHELDQIVDLFTDDGIYHAFGEDYSMADFPTLIESAPRGQLIVNPPVLTLDGDVGTGEQHYTFINQETHALRLAWYSDHYRREAQGWRFERRTTTFLRRSGGFDSGNAHAPIR